MKIQNRVEDVYQWCVVYRNDVLLHEEDATQGFASVKQEQVKLLSLLSLAGVPSHHVAIPSCATPVFFRRRSIELNPNTNEEAYKTVHCIGWKRGDEATYLF